MDVENIMQSSMAENRLSCTNEEQEVVMMHSEENTHLPHSVRTLAIFLSTWFMP